MCRRVKYHLLSLITRAVDRRLVQREERSERDQIEKKRHRLLQRHATARVIGRFDADRLKIRNRRTVLLPGVDRPGESLGVFLRAFYVEEEIGVVAGLFEHPPPGIDKVA